MIGVDFRTTPWPFWLAALGITLVTLAGELAFENLSPVVAPYLCAAVVGFRLPSRQFLALLGLIAAAISAPLILDSSAQQLAHRVIGWCGLLVIMGVRFSPLDWLKVLATWEKAESGFTAVSSGDSPSTQIHVTEHRASRQPSEDFSLDVSMADDFIPSALDRLRTGGKFSDDQIKLVETEMHLLEGHSIAINYASSLQNGIRIGRFVIDGPLGRGGEGNVYRAHDDNGEPAAIKILHNMRVSDRFRREMHMVRQLAHPNIVTAYEVGEFRGLPFITMELLKGPDLHALVRESGPMNWLQSAQYILQAARALAHAHRRDLIHRDMKPGNLILHGEGMVKLVDLGLAAMCGNDTAMDSVFQFETKEGHLAGTLPYMAPEQARSLANATVRSDIYALGATWFYLLTGRERLRGKTFAKQFENLIVHGRFNALPDDCMPSDLRQIYKRMVAYNVENRYESCAEVASKIEAALETAGESFTVEELHVLVVEDSRTDMVLTIELLRRSNPTLSIHQARSLKEGIDVCRRMAIELVILDLSLPDSSGVDTVKSFREAVGDVPLVVLSSMAQDQVASKCLAAGADTFLSKNALTAHRIERTIFVTLSRCGMARSAST